MWVEKRANFTGKKKLKFLVTTTQQQAGENDISRFHLEILCCLVCVPNIFHRIDENHRLVQTLKNHLTNRKFDPFRFHLIVQGNSLDQVIT